MNKFMARVLICLFSLQAQASLQDGLVAYYPLDGNASDASGHGYNGTLNTVSATDNRFGLVPGALTFNGITSFITVPDSSALDLNTAFTLSAWIMWNGTSEGGIVSKSRPCFGSGYQIQINPGGHVAVAMNNDPGQQGGNHNLEISSTAVVNPGKWHFVCGTLDGTTVRVYVDGVLSGSGLWPWGSLLDSSYPLYIGRVVTFAYDWRHVGKIDEVRIYNRALSATEVQQLYVYQSPPLIKTQPTSQTVTANSPVQFTVLATGADPMTYQWMRDGQNMINENSATLSIPNAQNANVGSYSVRIANAYGSTTSASAKLTVLGGDQFIQVIEQIPELAAPEKPEGVDSLVIITHGYQGTGGLADVSWIEDMAGDIRTYLASQGITNWKVQTYNWAGRSWVYPDGAIVVGNGIGKSLGQKIAVQSWKHVHLIAHSAGAALIQAAADQIWDRSPQTTVHTTFLDPYIGFLRTWRSAYGSNADWSDNYFSDDWTGNWTASRLPNAHNVNVTRLDPASSEQLLCFYSGNAMPGTTPVTVCSSTTKDTWSHSWPHDFYTNTIPPSVLPGSLGYGFPLSKEGGGWDNHANYPINNEPVILGGSTYLQGNSLEIRTGNLIDFSALPSTSSATGVILLPGLGLQLTSISSTMYAMGISILSQSLAPLSQPEDAAWFSTAVTVTGSVNFVSCDIAFTSPANALGLLTVYWETNAIGSVDERVVSVESETYRFALPATVPAGTYALGFRLDSFTNITSSVSVTNVATGIAGSMEPVSLDMSGTTAGMYMTLSGPSAYNYLVEASTNLVDWAPFAVLANTNGAVRFYDPDMPNHKQRFYRAVRP